MNWGGRRWHARADRRGVPPTRRSPLPRLVRAQPLRVTVGAWGVLPTKLLSQQKLTDGAVELIDEHGLEEFTMPRLASSLGVRTSSLYRYFADRQSC